MKWAAIALVALLSGCNMLGVTDTSVSNALARAQLEINTLGRTAVGLRDTGAIDREQARVVGEWILAGTNQVRIGMQLMCMPVSGPDGQPLNVMAHCCPDEEAQCVPSPDLQGGNANAAMAERSITVARQLLEAAQ